ncbi:DUF6083 domain-containing protein [Streptomyces sp. NPDC047049]|uniref:DUF6083 domain-containing protein n=1 Tax=Streptomyces sp. NPDC047049 TaxID=3156688 RepID=UPI0033E2ECCF
MAEIAARHQRSAVAIEEQAVRLIPPSQAVDRQHALPWLRDCLRRGTDVDWRSALAERARRERGRDIAQQWHKPPPPPPAASSSRTRLGRQLALSEAQPEAPDEQPAPRAAHWPPERGRAARCPDCQVLVQQYPLAGRGWVVLNAAELPGAVVPGTLRWSVDEEGVAALTPAAAHAVRIAHSETCLASGEARTGLLMLTGRPRDFTPGLPEEPAEPSPIAAVPVLARVDRQVVIREVACPVCGAPPGVPCRRSEGYRSPRKRPHAERIAAWAGGSA